MMKRPNDYFEQDPVSGLYLPGGGRKRQSPLLKRENPAALMEDLRDAIETARKYGMRGASGYVECVAAAQKSSALFTTYTTSKLVTDATGRWVSPPQYMSVGRKGRMRVTGALSNIVTTPGTITFELKAGPTANIIVWSSGAIQLNATAHTTLPFFMDVTLTCQVAGDGTTAKILGVGTIEGIMITRTAGQTDDAQGHQGLVIPQTNPAQGTGFDSTVAMTWELWAGFSISNAGNGIRVDEYSLEWLN